MGKNVVRCHNNSSPGYCRNSDWLNDFKMIISYKSMSVWFMWFMFELSRAVIKYSHRSGFLKKV
jgi:hypothetical protein